MGLLLTGGKALAKNSYLLTPETALLNHADKVAASTALEKRPTDFPTF